MGKIINAPYETSCKQTQKKISKGDKCYYLPGQGYFHQESFIYQDKINNGGLRQNKPLK